MGFLLCPSIVDCPRFRMIKNPSTKQNQSIRKPLKTADTSTFSHFLHTSQSKLQTQGEKIGREECNRGNVWANMGHTFLKLLDAKFTEEHLLHKIFNRNTVKISYSCMPNLKQNIDGHNKSSLPMHWDRAVKMLHLYIDRVEIISKNRLFTKRPSGQIIIT